MKIEQTIRKIITLCQNEDQKEEIYSVKEEDITTPPSMDEVTTHQTVLPEHHTFPTDNPRNQHPSHFRTAPAAAADNTSPNSSGNGAVGTTRSARRPFRRTPTVELEENPAYHPLGGPDYLKILAKYNLLAKDEHQGLVVCRFTNAGNKVTREPQVIKVDQFSAHGNQEFLAHVAIGDPPQTLRVDLDTGSSDFWLFSTLLKEEKLRTLKEGNHQIFDPTKSKSWRWPAHEWGGASRPLSFRRKQLEWDIEYGDGSSASGIVGFDNVQLGDITISQQPVQLAKIVTGRQFSEGSADGILGLGFGHLNSVRPDPVRTPLESMIQQGKLQEQLFTVNLGSECFFSFGFIDQPTRAGREIHWVDVDSRGGFWMFSSRHARVGNKRLKRWGGAAIADTGSSIILTHPHIVWMIYKQIDGARYDSRQPGWVYPVSSHVPEVAFSVGDDDSCMVVINESNMKHSDLGSGYVFGAIQENPAYESGGLQFDIFGTPFLRHVYAIFDIKGERFGVIKESHEEVLTTEICDSPVSMENFREPADEEIEDSVDGSIREEFPRRSSTRRSSTMFSMMDSPIPEMRLETEVIPENP